MRTIAEVVEALKGSWRAMADHAGSCATCEPVVKAVLVGRRPELGEPCADGRPLLESWLAEVDAALERKRGFG